MVTHWIGPSQEAGSKNNCCRVHIFYRAKLISDTTTEIAYESSAGTQPTTSLQSSSYDDTQAAE